MVRVTVYLIFSGAWIFFGSQEALAFKCCMSCEFSADSETECAEHHCSVHGAQDSCDFLGVGDSGEDSSGTGSSGASSAVELPPAAQAAIEKLGYELGQKLARDLFGPTPAEKAAEAERRRGIMLEMQQHVDEMEEIEKTEFEDGKGELLGEMKGYEPEELEPEEWRDSVRQDFESYQGRIDEARVTLEKLKEKVAQGKADKGLLDWCILHMPLVPTQPILPIPDGQYQTMLKNYWARKSAWDERCEVRDEIGRAGSAAPLVFKDLSSPQAPEASTPGEVKIEPKSWDACLNDYDRHKRGCEKGDHLNQKNECLNNAIKEWLQCIKKTE